MSKINFKKWPYWVKGGIILTLLILFAFGITLSSTLRTLPDPQLEFQGLRIVAVFALFFGLPSLILAPLNLLLPPRVAAQIIVIEGFVIYFIAGALLGWLYGKMKNRKINS